MQKAPTDGTVQHIGDLTIEYFANRVAIYGELNLDVDALSVQQAQVLCQYSAQILAYLQSQQGEQTQVAAREYIANPFA